MGIRFFIFFIPLLFSIGLLSQEKQRYFEDQFYMGLSYNSLGGKVDQLKENKFSFIIYLKTSVFLKIIFFLTY